MAKQDQKTPINEVDTRRGWGPWRRDWYSICSLHHIFRPECRLCRTGGWLNHWRWCAGHVVYTVAPDIWRRWANRGRKGGCKPDA